MKVRISNADPFAIAILSEAKDLILVGSIVGISAQPVLQRKKILS